MDARPSHCGPDVYQRPPVRVEAALPLPETLGARYLREVRVLVDDEWRPVASEEFAVEVPEWAAAEPLWSLISCEPTAWMCRS